MRFRLGVTAGLLALVAGAAVAAPVLKGPPPRALTDPRSIASETAADARPVPIADLFYIRGGQGGAWSPDGRTVVISTNLTGRFNLWAVPADGGFPLQLTQSDDRQTGVAVTPGGQVIFQSDRAGAEIWDLYATPLTGGAVTNLTATDDVTETGAKVSPDGRSIAFERRLKSAPQTDIAVMDLATRRVRTLTSEKAPDRGFRLAGWTDGGRSLIVTRVDFNQTHGQVMRLDVASGRLEPVTGEAGKTIATDVSRDGRLAAVTFEKDGANQAGVLDLASRAVKPIKADAWEQDSGEFSPDGRTLTWSSNVDGRTTLSAYDVADGASRALPLPPGVAAEASSSDSWSPDGSRLLVSHNAGNRPQDFWVVDVRANTARPLTRLGLASVDPQRLPKSQIVHYPSADGTVVSAILWVPFNLKRDGSAPAVVLPHGGPTGQTTDSFNRTALALASRGYVALAPNPRGSTGYGRAFQDANHKDLGGGDLEDEVAGAKFLTATGYVDARRIGITGGSYGGYMTLMAVAKTPTVWAAGVEQYGIIDWAEMYRTEAPTLQAYQRGLLGQPDTDAAVYKATSPMTFIHQTTAPLLVLQGDNDIRVPRGQAEQVIAAIKKKNGVVEAKFYPNEGHGFVKRENQIDALTRTVDWFDRHLKPAAR